MRKTKVAALAAVLVCGAGVLPGPAWAADKAAFDVAYAEADAARKAAGAVGYEWRDTRKMLKRAAALAEKGDYAAAIELAKEARFQGERAQAQAAEQAEQWQSFVVK